MQPVIASVGSLSQGVQDIKALADTGAATMFSLSMEQLLRDAGWVLTAQPASLFLKFSRLGPGQMLSM